MIARGTKRIAGLGLLVAALTACGALVGRDLEQATDGNVLPDGAPGDGASLGDGGTPGDGASPSDGASPDDGASLGDSAACGGANLQDDANNCGRCGHACGGGTCAAGVCQAWTIVPGQPGSSAIALDGTSIYWASEPTGQIMKSDKDGKSLVVLSFIKDTSPFALAIDDANVYWSEDRTDTPVRRCAKTGCDGGGAAITPETLANTDAIVVDGKNVYVAEYSWGAIGRATKAGGGALSFMTTHLDHVYGLAADDASVYFSTSSTIGMLANTVPGVPNDTDYDAAVPTTLLGTVKNAIGLILAADGNLYWAENNDVGAVKSIPKAGASVPTVISATEPRPLAVAVDDTNVYWTAEGTNSSGDPGAPIYTNGYVAMCPKAACPASGPVKIATGIHNPGAIAVDATAIYFTVFGNPGSSGTITEGAIMKALK